MAVTHSHPARQLEKQSTAELVNWVRTVLGLTQAQIGSLVGATGRSVQRWEGMADPTLPVGARRVKIDHLRDFRRLLQAQFQSNEVALKWLHTPVPLLKDQRPIDLIKRGRLDQVNTVLAGSYAGAFA